jgi:hypothetical protein
MPLDMREWLPEDDLVFIVAGRSSHLGSLPQIEKLLAEAAEADAADDARPARRHPAVGETALGARAAGKVH